MKTEKTDNELIAEFMGARGKIIDGEYRIDYKQEGMKHFWSIPRYHTSWDWLMPVVEKIRPLVHKIDTDSTAWRRLSGKSIFAKLEDVYKAVVEFIRWYNSQNS